MVMIKNLKSIITFWLACAFSFGVLGCGNSAEKIRQTDQVLSVVKDHQVVCQETCDALIKSIKAEISQNPDMKAAQKESYVNLIDRLEYIKYSADIIKRYFVATEIDEQMLIDLGKAKVYGDNIRK